MLSVPVSLQDVTFLDVVGTAAAVTFISVSICLHIAGRDMKMEGFVVGPVALKLEKTHYPKQNMSPHVQDDIL